MSISAPADAPLATDRWPGRAVRFVQTCYAPGLHVGFAALWFLGLWGLLLVGDPEATKWPVAIGAWLGIPTLFLALLVLRILDEIKDFDYDARFNPDRPLVTGAVSHRDLVLLSAVSIALVLLLHLGQALYVSTIVLLDLGYGIGLLYLDRASRTLRESIFLTLLVTYPVNVALSLYTYVLYTDLSGRPMQTSGGIAIAAFALAFLHYEFSRKTYWRHHASEQAALYSNAISPVAAAATAVGFALGASALALVVATPWQHSGLRSVSGWGLALPPLCAFLGVRRFFRIRSAPVYDKRQGVMTPSAMIFLIAFYAVAIVHAGLALPLTWSGSL